MALENKAKPKDVRQAAGTNSVNIDGINTLNPNSHFAPICAATREAGI